jgi:hypothetical protein
VTVVHVEHEGRTYALGRHLEPTHDPASRAFPAETAPLKTVFHQHHGPILNQRDLGACTGFSTATALDTDPLIPAGRRLLNGDDAKGIYSWATHHDPYPGVWPPTDTGSSGLAVAKAAKHLGLIGSYRHAFGLQHVLGALAARPLIVGIPWLSGMFTPGRDGVLSVTGSVEGGHEIALIGLDVENELVVVPNTWSETWGVPAPECGITTGGTCRLRWTDLGSLLAQQGDATVLVP